MTKQKEYFIMDESDRPFEDNENPFPRTKEDEEFDKMIIEKYHLEPRLKADIE